MVGHAGDHAGVDLCGIHAELDLEIVVLCIIDKMGKSLYRT